MGFYENMEAAVNKMTGTKSFRKFKRKVYAGTAKNGRTVRRTTSQTGRTTTSRDSERRALAPGKRISRNGKTYYETRRNRSDKNQRKRL